MLGAAGFALGPLVPERGLVPPKPQADKKPGGALRILPWMPSGLCCPSLLWGLWAGGDTMVPTESSNASSDGLGRNEERMKKAAILMP